MASAICTSVSRDRVGLVTCHCNSPNLIWEWLCARRRMYGCHIPHTLLCTTLTSHSLLDSKSVTSGVFNRLHIVHLRIHSFGRPVLPLQISSTTRPLLLASHSLSDPRLLPLAVHSESFLRLLRCCGSAAGRTALRDYQVMVRIWGRHQERAEQLATTHRTLIHYIILPPSARVDAGAWLYR